MQNESDKPEMPTDDVSALARLSDKEIATALRAMNRLEPELNSGCWLWPGATVTGYGNIQVTKTPPKFRRVHILSWMLKHGRRVPDGIFVLHTCDTRQCANPDHLFLGDHTANMADMRSKGRGRTSSHNQPKLSAQAIRQMRSDLSAGMSVHQAARKFGVDRVTVRYHRARLIASAGEEA